MTDAVEIVKDILVTRLYVELNPSDISVDDHFHRDLGLDSLGFIELRCAVEERFDINVSDEEFNPDNFISIRTLCAFVEKAQSAISGRGAIY
jgi:acyl carrier protein